MFFVVVKTKDSCFVRVSTVVLLGGLLGGMVTARLSVAKGPAAKVLGLDKVIAFTYSPAKDFDLT